MRLLLLTLVLSSHFAAAQSKSIYKSEADALVTVRTISVLPVFDNLRGIYSRPVESALIEKLNKSHRWEYAEANVAGPILTPDELEENPETVKSLSLGMTADAFISISISKGPSGIAIKMSLFLKADQKLIAQEAVTELQSFDVESVKRQSENLLNKLLKKLPYSGMVISRQGTRVTVNLGRMDGVEPDQMLSVVQIIKLVRHPKFNFLISTEKEVLGKVMLLKVDDTLSFGRIVTEKEPGAIQVNAKLANLDNVVYPNANTLSDNQESADGLGERPEGKITFGANPSAWLPKKKPTFGMVGARIGVGQYRESVHESADTLDATAPFYPSVALDGEIWLTPKWSMHAQIRQGIITTSNPRSGGSPRELSHSLSAHAFLFGYNMRLASTVSAPKVEALFGYANYRLFVDESNPAGLTTKTYSGLKMGVAGSYPIAGDSPYSIGANLMFMFQANLKEASTADNSVNSFGFFVDKDLTINLRARGALDFELYASDYSGGSASSSSQKHTTASAGLYYLF